MLGALLLVCGLTSLIGGMLGSNSSKDNEFLITRSKQQSTYKTKGAEINKREKMLKIYVSGAVVKPGLYDVPVGARADDAVAAAGGMLEEADPTRVNLAQRLKDGMQVNVPYIKQNNYRKEYKATVKQAASNQQNNKTNYTRRPDLGIININTATAKELETLPGVGPSMSKKIINYRETSRFRSVDELIKVPGIGKAKLERFRDRITI